MKQFFIFLSAVLLAQSLAAQTNFQRGTFAESKAIAQREQKPIFVFFTAAWCGPCQQMKREIFPLPTVGEYLNQAFVVHYADIDSADGKALYKGAEVRGVPTMGVFSPDGELLYGFAGVHNETDFLEKARRAHDPKYQLRTLRLEYERDTTDLAAIRTYAVALENIGRSAAARMVFQKLLGRPAEQIANPDDFAVWELLAASPVESAFNLVAENRALFAEKVGAERVMNYLDAGMRQVIQVIGQVPNDTLKVVWREYVQRYFPADERDLYFSMMDAWKNFADPSKDLKAWDKYISLCAKRWPDEADWIAQRAHEICETKSALKKALTWSEKAVAFAKTDSDKIAFLHTQAQLLFKLHRRADAQKTVDQVIALCESKAILPPSGIVELQAELASKRK